MYCKCGEMEFAHHLFDRMPKQNVVSFNSLISGYAQKGFHDHVMNVFAEARLAGLKLDKFTFAGALSVCVQSGDIELVDVDILTRLGACLRDLMNWTMFLGIL